MVKNPVDCLGRTKGGLNARLLGLFLGLILLFLTCDYTKTAIINNWQSKKIDTKSSDNRGH